MYGGLVFLIIIIVRLMAAHNRGQSTVIDWTWPRRALVLMGRIMVLMLAVGELGGGGSIWLGLACLLVAFLHPATRWFVTPLGIPYVSYWLTRAAFFGGGRSEAIFNELQARLRYGRLLGSERLAGYALQLFRGQTDKKVRGVNVAIRAVLDALMGDLVQSRLLFKLASELNWRLAPRYVRVFAQAWLMAEAARRGAWQEVVRISKHGPWTRRAFFFRAAACRILQLKNAPSNLTLALAWLAAPSRIACFPLFIRARSLAPRLPLQISSESLERVRHSTCAALRLCPGTITRHEVRVLAGAWQEVFERYEHEELTEARAEELASDIDAAQIASEFESEVLALLAELWRNSLPDGSPETDEPDLLVSAKDELQFELLGEFETITGRLCTDDDEPKGEHDDYEPYWRSWARLRGVARDFLDVLPDRGALLSDAGCTQVLNHGAWLYNGRRARALAQDVFRWLLPRFPKDSENHRIVKRNVRLSQDA